MIRGRLWRSPPLRIQRHAALAVTQTQLVCLGSTTVVRHWHANNPWPAANNTPRENPIERAFNLDRPSRPLQPRLSSLPQRPQQTQKSHEWGQLRRNGPARAAGVPGVPGMQPPGPGSNMLGNGPAAEKWGTSLPSGLSKPPQKSIDTHNEITRRNNGITKQAPGKGKNNSMNARAQKQKQRQQQQKLQQQKKEEEKKAEAPAEPSMEHILDLPEFALPPPPVNVFDHRRKTRKVLTPEEELQKAKSRQRRRENSFRFDEDEDYDAARLERMEERRRRKEEKRRKREMEAAQGPMPILLPEFISVGNLGTALRVRPQEFLQQLGELGFEDISLESIMTGETAALVAQEYGFEPTVDSGESVDLRPRPAPEDPSALPQRPPIVTIMGHVDHGKTTMLDFLRKSSVAAQEHGGITQHIGAFSVRLSGGKQITFLDTPGHAAFLTMRQRGANVTDIVVLVVAADDSVMPQTLEALKHAREAKVPIIVAINKIDKDEANVEKVKADLARHGVDIEDFGGDVQTVCVSGRTGQGMPDLEENILTLAEMLDVRAEADGLAEGWVLESSIKDRVGRAASVLVKRGTLRRGDVVVAGTAWARVRQLRNEAGVEIAEALPGAPVEVLGWRQLPDAGDQVLQAPTEARAKEATEYRLEVQKREQAATASNETEKEAKEAKEAKQEKEAKEAMKDGEDAAEGKEEEVKESGPVKVNFIVKADVMGSVEAVTAAIMEIGNHEVQPQMLRAAPGSVTESDIEHAASTGSSIISFNGAASVPGAIRRMAKDSDVALIEHSVIYHLIDEVRARLSDKLTPTMSTRVLGEAEVVQIFPINVRGRVYHNIAGCRVRNGIVSHNGRYRVLRGKEKVFDGKLESLKQGKKDASEVRKGNECGMSFEDWADVQVGDMIQAYEEVYEKRTL